MAFILASGSPRRRELLTLAGVKDFVVRPADVDETLPAGIDPADAVMLLSRKKALAAAEAAEGDDIVLAADTLVFLEKEPLSKPKDREDAFRMLRRLSGRKHQVMTGFSLWTAGQIRSYCECTDLYFNEMTDREIRDYIATGEPMDKAGAYGVQGLASRFICRIDGDYYNVMGLPVCRLYGALRQLGLERVL